MAQKGFYFDQRFCVGCKACQVACKDKNDLEVGQLWRKVKEVTGGQYVQWGEGIKPDVYAYWISMACNHCQDPKCVKNCPTGAMYKRQEDGVVLVDEKKCIGCRYCVWSCPYDAPQYNEQKGKVGKCNLCVDLAAKGEPPVCVAACPVRALDAGDIEELKKKYQGTDWVAGLADPGITKPSVTITPHKNALGNRRGG